MDKNIQPKQESDLNQKQYPEKRDEGNYNTKEADLYEENIKDGALKPTHKISENIHDKPAEEQQFENNS